MTRNKNDDLILFRVEWVKGYGDAPIEYRNLEQLQNDDRWDLLDDFFIRLLRNSDVGAINSWSDPSGRIDFLKIEDNGSSMFAEADRMPVYRVSRVHHFEEYMEVKAKSEEEAFDILREAIDAGEASVNHHYLDGDAELKIKRIK
jgi:hypothetical protein|tara:strand:+ start:810 stop:1244 length:435 start_codon:yes stop_codon:yes gene_type:complete